MAANVTEVTVEVAPIMREVRRRTRAIGGLSDDPRRNARVIPAALVNNVARFRDRTRAVREAVDQIGQFPAVPDTWRGFVGSFAVRAVQRSLFWFIPQLRAAHRQLALALEEQAVLADQLVNVLQDTRLQLEALRVEKTSRES